ncbi:MAG: twin-arginine translocase subunit TatC [Solirubrobacteraceae bacterium]
MRGVRPIGHEDRLSIVDHLDELRSRLFVCLGVLVVAFGICFWQNHALLDVLNRALPHELSVSNQKGLGSVPNRAVRERKGLKKIEHGAQALASSARLTPAERAAANQIAEGASQAAAALPNTVPPQEKPITIGVGEPFTTTLTVAAYFALLFALPVIIYEGYAFVIPALTPKERRVALPVMAVAPLLFMTGVVFAYLIVLPPAVHFLQGYNSERFDILVQAKSYYTFEIFTMLGIGLAFQLPLGLLALQQMGVLNSQTLIRQWRYATVIIAVIAAAMPGADPVTTALETLPLILLYLASILLLKIVDRRAAARAAAEFSEPAGDNLGS